MSIIDGRDVIPVADHLDGRARLLDECRQNRRIAVIQRRHAVERVGQRAKAEPDREHAVAIFRGRVTGGVDDSLIEEVARNFVDAFHLRGHRHHHERTATRFDQRVRPCFVRR